MVNCIVAISRFLNPRVDSIPYGEVVGVVWECCAISLNDNYAVAFSQNRSSRLLVLRKGGGRGRGCFGSFLGPGEWGTVELAFVWWGGGWLQVVVGPEGIEVLW